MTICGRLFAVMWTLYGLVITGLVVGNLTASLSASIAMTFSDVDLYQSKVEILLIWRTYISFILSYLILLYIDSVTRVASPHLTLPHLTSPRLALPYLVPFVFSLMI